jgi:choice-of-anchor C domain-containing protein
VPWMLGSGIPQDLPFQATLARVAKRSNYMALSHLTMKALVRNLSAAVLMVSFAGHAQSVVNGGFEQGSDPNANGGNNIGLYAPDASSLDGWVVSSGTVDYIGSRWAAGEGARSLDLSGVTTGTIYQTVTGFTPGMAYRLSFLLAGNPEAGPSVKTARVGVGSLFADFAFDTTGFSASNMGWRSEWLDFIATSSSLSISFAGLDNHPYGAALDDVAVAALTIGSPVPSGDLNSSAMLALGLIGLSLAKFRWIRA